VLFFPLLMAATLIYAGLLLHMRGMLRQNSPGESLSPHDMAVTVIVAARNEENNLPQLFRHLEQQKLSPSLPVEFILVNDRSTDGTGRLLEEQAARDPRFRYIHIHDRLPGFAPKKRAIDTAVRAARGQYILLTDADGRPGPLWIVTLMAYFERGADMLLGYAPYSIDPGHRFVQGLVALEYFSVAAVAAATTFMRFPVTCVGTNMAYRRQLFLDVDGFGPHKHILSGDDDLFLTHVREQKKYDIRYACDSRAHVFNAPPKTLRQYIHQRLRYASKGFKYPLKVVLALSAYVLYNAALLWALIAVVVSPSLGAAVLFIFALKVIPEFLFLNKAARIMGERRVLRWFLPAAALHIFYILFFGILGQFNLFRWKEEKIQHGVLS